MTSSMCKKCEFWKLLMSITTIPTIKPRDIPINKSVKIIPKIVTIKGVNCFQPNRYISLNKEGFANLYPTINRIEANTDKGILFNKLGIKITEISKIRGL